VTSALLQDIHIVGPLVAGVALIAWVLVLRVREGLGPKDLLIDRQFLTALFYTGALLSIYLSCVHFYGVAAAYSAGATNGP
jgi:hypothetical protein